MPFHKSAELLSNIAAIVVAVIAEVMFPKLEAALVGADVIVSNIILTFIAPFYVRKQNFRWELYHTRRVVYLFYQHIVSHFDTRQGLNNFIILMKFRHYSRRWLC